MIIQFRMCCLLSPYTQMRMFRRVKGELLFLVIWHMVRLQIRCRHRQQKEINKTKIQCTCKIPNNFMYIFLPFFSNPRCYYICCWWRGLMLEESSIILSFSWSLLSACVGVRHSFNEFKTRKIISKIVSCRVHELSIIKLKLTITFCYVSPYFRSLSLSRWNPIANIALLNFAGFKNVFRINSVWLSDQERRI